MYLKIVLSSSISDSYKMFDVSTMSGLVDQNI